MKQKLIDGWEAERRARGDAGEVADVPMEIPVPAPETPQAAIPWKPGGFTQREAKAYCPPGARISKTTSVKQGKPFWQVKGDFLLHAITRRYDSHVIGEHDNEALRYVLRLCWHQYTMAHGQQEARCPWLLGDMIQA